MTGREILVQALREKCLHKLIADKYQDEGVLFWTFFKYLDDCFVEDGTQATSLEECYDWSTVIINGIEEVRNIDLCVQGSFEAFDSFQSDNALLRKDRLWANELHLQFHPSITINNKTYTGDVQGQELALAICDAYKEKPDECDLSWKIKTYQQGALTDFQDLDMPAQRDYIYEDATQHSVSVSDHPNRKKMYVAVLSILLVNFCVLFWVRRRMKRQVSSEVQGRVNEAVTQYFALSGSEQRN